MEGIRLWDPFLSRNPHCAPPPEERCRPLAACHVGGRIVLLSPAPTKEKKNSRFTEPEGGAKNVCACVCPCIYIHIYKYVYTNMRTYTDAHIYTRTQNYSSVYWLGPHSGQGDLSPDHLFHGSVQRICQCFVGVFFIKQIIGEKKNLQTVQVLETLAG